MLTGDRFETAVAVSYDCRLITEDYKKVYMVFDKSIPVLVDEITATLDILKETKIKVALVLEGNVIRRFPRFWLIRLDQITRSQDKRL